MLSGGRLLFGVGAGNREEVGNHGVRPADRWPVMRERVLAMKAIWTTSEAEFHGDHVSFDPLWSWPKPRQHPHPPILVGGYGPRVLERVVEYGDEWLAMVAPGQAPLRLRVQQLHAMATAAGRSRLTVAVQLYGDPPREDLIEHYIATGVDRIDLSLPYASPDETTEFVARLGQLVRKHRDRS